MGCASKLKVIMMEKIWMLLPDIQAMKHMKPICLMGAVARAYSACRVHGHQVKRCLPRLLVVKCCMHELLGIICLNGEAVRLHTALP